MNKEKQHKENYNQSLRGKDWLGIVVDIEDPLQRGRAKIRIFERFDQRAPIDDKGTYPDEPLKLEDYLDESHFLLPNKALPWMFQVNSQIFAGGENPGSGSFCTPKLGSLVKVNFVNDDIYSGEYHTVHKLNEKMMGIITREDGDYVNANVTFFDEDEDYWMLYTKSIGLQVYHKGSQIVIRPDSSIFIEHKDTESMIELKGPDIKIISNRDIDITSENRITVNSSIVKINGDNTYLGSSPTFSAVHGEPLMKLLKAMAVNIDGKMFATPGVTTTAVDAAENLILAQTVKVGS